MRTTFRRTSLSALALASGFALLAGCSAQAPAETPETPEGDSSITIGFSPLNQAAEALVGLGQGVKGYAESLGDKVLIADPDNDPSTQVQQTTAWIENGQVQAIWFMAIDGPSMAQVIETAQEHHVVLLAGGMPSDYGLDGPAPGVSFSMLSYAENGRVTGEVAAECVQERLGGAGNAILLTAATGSAGDADMEQGLKTALTEGAPDLKIVSEAAGDQGRLGSQNAVASALQAHPDANVLIGLNDEASLGGISALKAAGKDLSKMCIIGGGGGAEALAAVDSGEMYAVTAVDFASDLTQNVDLLVKMAADPTAMGVQLTTPTKVSRQ